MTNPFAPPRGDKFTLRQLLQAAMANRWECNRNVNGGGYVLTKDDGVIVLTLDKSNGVVRVRINGTVIHANRTRRAMETIRGSFLR